MQASGTPAAQSAHFIKPTGRIDLAVNAHRARLSLVESQDASCPPDSCVNEWRVYDGKNHLVDIDGQHHLNTLPQLPSKPDVEEDGVGFAGFSTERVRVNCPPLDFHKDVHRTSIAPLTLHPWRHTSGTVPGRPKWRRVRCALFAVHH